MDDKGQGKGNEEEVHFVDRRRFAEDESERAESAEAPAEARPAPEAEPAPRTDKAQRPPQLTELPDVYSLLSAYVATLGSQAFVWMGLLKDPISGKVRKDMAQAKIAIDVCEFLVGKIEPKLGEGDRRDMQRMLSDLKVNFVNQSQGGA
jgi:hypothetical protein